MIEKNMGNHYSTLGLNNSATNSEVRRAYRVLARRYHPDLNPGKKESEDRFKRIAEAYAVLNDPEKRRAYDSELERGQKFNADAYFEALRKNFRAQNSQAQARPQRRPAPERSASPLRGDAPGRAFAGLLNLFTAARTALGTIAWPRLSRSSKGKRTSLRVSVIEVSLNMRDAVLGAKKTIEIAEPEGTRKVSVKIPAGVRNGSVVRLRASNQPTEELVLIVRLAAHPVLSLENRGLVLAVPITIGEALNGSSITIPTLDEPLVVKIPPGTQSGQELRLKDKGIISKDGQRGDLFVRFMIRIPESPDAIGLKERAKEFEAYYGTPVRQGFPTSLLELGK